MAKESMVIITDTREQRLYQFESGAGIGTLNIGDYSIAGAEDLVAVERKSLDDLIGSLSTGRARFENELCRGRALDSFHLVIEATMEDIAHGRYRSRMNPKAVIQSLVAFSIRYRMPVWFAGNRENSQRLTESILCKYYRELDKRWKGVQAA